MLTVLPKYIHGGKKHCDFGLVFAKVTLLWKSAADIEGVNQARLADVHVTAIQSTIERPLRSALRVYPPLPVLSIPFPPSPSRSLSLVLTATSIASAKHLLYAGAQFYHLTDNDINLSTVISINGLPLFPRPGASQLFWKYFVQHFQGSSSARCILALSLLFNHWWKPSPRIKHGWERVFSLVNGHRSRS